MTVVSVNNAEELADLIRRARAGEDIVLTADGVVLARLVPLDGVPNVPPGPRCPGSLKGLNIPDEFFFDPLPEEEVRAWEGEGTAPK